LDNFCLLVFSGDSAYAIGMKRLPDEKRKPVFSTLESLEHKTDVIMSDWTTVWSELRKNLLNQPTCPIHSNYPCVRTLAQGVINDVIHVGKDEIIVRSHRTMRRDSIGRRRFRTWWQYLEENGFVSLKSGAQDNPHPWRSRLVGAIMATCLPLRIKIVNNNLLELVNH